MLLWMVACLPGRQRMYLRHKQLLSRAQLDECATEYEEVGERSDIPDRQRRLRSKKKVEEISGGDGVCSELGDTAGQKENVDGSSVCEFRGGGYG